MQNNIKDFNQSKIIDDYKKFMGINFMPNIIITYKSTFNLFLHKQERYLAQYKFINAEHNLILLNEFLTNKNYESIIFHELTHCLDTYLLKNDTDLAFIKWYKEYHAGQIELAKQLGIKSINDNFRFKMSIIIDTPCAKDTVINILKANLTDLNSQIKTINLNNYIEPFNFLFVYLGKKSICSMYAIDFDEGELDESELLTSKIGFLFPAINKVFNGFMNLNAIKKSQNLAKFWYSNLNKFLKI